MHGACEVYYQQELLRVVPLLEGEITIGRNHINAIYLPHPNVSRDHGVISFADGQIYYEDFSSFGSLVNGALIQGTRLEIKHGDAIELAEFRIVYNSYSRRHDIQKTSAVSTRYAHASDRWRLIVESPDDAQRSFVLSDENITVGTDPQNTIVVGSKNSAAHALAVLTLKDGIYLYIDDKAAYIDGERAGRGIVRFHELSKVTYCGLNLRLLREKSQQQDVLIGASACMAEVRHNIELAAQRLKNISVLISGESGTGKELAARLIHDLSDRKSENFVAVNCTSIPETLAESLLFGHREGAFTNASKDHAGYFQNANRGTLFLDEIGDLPHSIQVKLLRAIEAQEIFPVGAAKPHKINVRVVSGTNRQIKDAEVRFKLGFRDDLYYRLAGFEIEMPPLRRHKEDISELIAHFHAELSKKDAVLSKVRISESALKQAKDYHWPGNVRELRHVIQKAVLLADNVVATLPISQSIWEMSGEDKFQSFTRMINEGIKDQKVMRTFGIPRSTYFRLKKKVSKVSLE